MSAAERERAYAASRALLDKRNATVAGMEILVDAIIDAAKAEILEAVRAQLIAPLVNEYLGPTIDQVGDIADVLGTLAAAVRTPSDPPASLAWRHPALPDPRRKS